MNRNTFIPNGNDDFQQRLQQKDTVHQYQVSQDSAVQDAQGKLETARTNLAREQEKLDMTPRLFNNRHNQAYGAQINVRDAARQTVENVEQELTKAQNDFARKRYLARLDAERQAAKEAREAPQRERAAKEKAAFRASAKTRWLESGGSEHAFNERFEQMWTDKVMERMQGPDLVEQTRQKLVRSGRYDI